MSAGMNSKGFSTSFIPILSSAPPCSQLCAVLLDMTTCIWSKAACLPGAQFIHSVWNLCSSGPAIGTTNFVAMHI